MEDCPVDSVSSSLVQTENLDDKMSGSIESVSTIGFSQEKDGTIKEGEDNEEERQEERGEEDNEEERQEAGGEEDNGEERQEAGGEEDNEEERQEGEEKREEERVGIENQERKDDENTNEDPGTRGEEGLANRETCLPIGQDAPDTHGGRATTLNSAQGVMSMRKQGAMGKKGYFVPKIVFSFDPPPPPPPPPRPKNVRAPKMTRPSNGGSLENTSVAPRQQDMAISGTSVFSQTTIKYLKSSGLHSKRIENLLMKYLGPDIPSPQRQEDAPH